MLQAIRAGSQDKVRAPRYYLVLRWESSKLATGRPKQYNRMQIPGTVKGKRIHDLMTFGFMIDRDYNQRARRARQSPNRKVVK